MGRTCRGRRLRRTWSWGRSRISRWCIAGCWGRRRNDATGGRGGADGPGGGHGRADFRAGGGRREERHRGAREGPWEGARRKPGGRFGGPRGDGKRKSVG